MANYKAIRSLRRGLLVLEALNEARSATACELSTSLDLSRSTVHRLLRTLVEEGFVYNVPGSDNFSLSSGMRRLCSSYDETERIVEAAGDVITDLSERILWPVDLAVPNGSAMVLRVSTHRQSPRTLYPDTKIGDIVPYASTAPGRAFLASIGEDECLRILQLSPAERSDHASTRESDPIFRVLEQVRQCGFGFRHGGLLPRTSAIAVPVQISNRPSGCLNLMYYTSTMTMAQAAKTYLPLLKETARAIEGRARS